MPSWCWLSLCRLFTSFRQAAKGLSLQHPKPSKFVTGGNFHLTITGFELYFTVSKSKSSATISMPMVQGFHRRRNSVICANVCTATLRQCYDRGALSTRLSEFFGGSDPHSKWAMIGLERIWMVFAFMFSTFAYILFSGNSICLHSPPQVPLGVVNSHGSFFQRIYDPDFSVTMHFHLLLSAVLLAPFIDASPTSNYQDHEDGISAESPESSDNSLNLDFSSNFPSNKPLTSTSRYLADQPLSNPASEEMAWRPFRLPFPDLSKFPKLFEFHKHPKCPPERFIAGCCMSKVKPDGQAANCANYDSWWARCYVEWFLYCCRFIDTVTDIGHDCVTPAEYYWRKVTRKKRAIKK